MLDPTNINWLMAQGSDWTPDFLAWMYYRNEPWAFPLGVMEGYSMPGEVSIGLTGSIPLLAVPLKLFKNVLPFEFQYFGFWMLLCFILQGFFSYKIIRLFKGTTIWQSILGGCFLMLSYSFMDRVGHLNLCAHWLVLGGIYVFFAHRDKHALWRHCLLIFMSVWIHPYLILFTLGIAYAQFFSMILENRSKWKTMLGHMAASLFATLFAWILIGNHVLSSSDSVSLGLGYYSTNLNTFWNPKVDSFFMNHIPYAFEDGQYEGLAYLGVGFWLAALVTLIFSFIKKTSFQIEKRTWGILLAGFVLFFFSVSHIVTFNEYTLFEIPIGKTLNRLASTFRATGRYVWLLQYILVIAWIVTLIRLPIKNSWKTGILGVALLLNIVDFSSYIHRQGFLGENQIPFRHFHMDFWEKIIQNTDELRMFPAHTRTYHSFGDDTPFVLLSSKYDLPINTGHLARYDVKKREEHRKDLLAKLENPTPLKNTTLITTEEHIVHFYRTWKMGNHEVFKEDGFLVFVPKTKSTLIAELKKGFKYSTLKKGPEFTAEFLTKHSNHYTFITVKDEASNNIKTCTMIQEWLRFAESDLGSLQFRESYAGVFHNNKKIKEVFGRVNKGSVSMTFPLGQKNIELFSSDMDNGNEARIFVEGVNHAVNERGLNIVVLSNEGELIANANFDTYQQCFQIVNKDTTGYKLWIRE